MMKSMGKCKRIYGFIILACIIFACYSFALYNKADAVDSNQYTDMYRVDNGIYDTYTDNIEKGEFRLSDYADVYYASTVNITWGEGDPDAVRFGYIYTIEGDDPITQFVPRELFLSETEEPVLYIGREYGFLVDTFRPSITNASGGVIQSDNLHSTVMLFTVDTQDNMVSTGDHLKLTIAPIFQAEFAYVERTADSMFVINDLPDPTDTEEDDFLNYWYNASLSHFSFPADGAAGYVVPVAMPVITERSGFTVRFLCPAAAVRTGISPKSTTAVSAAAAGKAAREAPAGKRCSATRRTTGRPVHRVIRARTETGHPIRKHYKI